MILRQNDIQVETNGIQKEVSFGIAPEGLSHILSVLRSSLYADPIRSAISETATNASDAMILAGKKDAPIEVTLPCALEDVFKVRDFAYGLTEQEVYKYLGQFGASLSRNTNKAVGTLGIGGKANFCYTSSYIINSYQKGTLKSFSAYIDESNIGKIAKLGTSKTSEPDGLEIVVPTKPEDRNKFIEKAQDVFRFWNVKPVFKGGKLPEETKKVILSGKGWELANYITKDKWGDDRTNRTSYAKMGGVGYPVKADKLSDYSEDLHKLISLGIIFEVPMGSVDFSASREELRYSEHTIKNLKKHLTRIHQEIIELVSEKFKSCTSIFQVKTLWRELFEKELSAYKDVIKVNWNGNVIESNYINYAPKKGLVKNADGTESHKPLWEAYYCETYGRLGRVRRLNCGQSVSQNVYFENADNVRRRCATLLEKESGIVTIVIDKNNKAATDAFEAQTLIKLNEIKSLLGVPKKAYVKGSGGGSDARYSAKILELFTNDCHYCSIDNWAVPEERPTEGVYVSIDRWSVDMGDSIFAKWMNVMEFIGEDVTIYGVKNAALGKIQSNPKWIHAKIFFRGKLTAYVEKEQLKDKLPDSNHSGKRFDGLRKKKFENSEFKPLWEVMDRENNQKYTEILALVNCGAYMLDLNNNVEKICEKIEKKYPLLNKLNVNGNSYYNDETELAIQYINMVEKLEKLENNKE
jgi:hypothetical protein